MFEYCFIALSWLLYFLVSRYVGSAATAAHSGVFIVMYAYMREYIYIYIYICLSLSLYIYIYICCSFITIIVFLSFSFIMYLSFMSLLTSVCEKSLLLGGTTCLTLLVWYGRMCVLLFKRHYLSNTANGICFMIRHVWRRHALDK